MLRVQIINSQGRFRVATKTMRKLAEWVLRRYGVNLGELDVLLVDDRAIEKLNRRFLGRAHPTDVIAFDGDIISGKTAKTKKRRPRILGDIVISLERAKEQSRTYGTSFEREVFLYLIHGILHLMGYDDHSLNERRRMELVQDSLLREALGVLR